MEYRRLGNTDLNVSSIGMGCVTFGREIDRAASFAVLDRAREGGINLFDTAEAYADGASETVLGQWLAERGHRHDCVIATKVNGTLTQRRIVESAEASLQRLQIEQIDLFQLHDWDSSTPAEDSLAGLSALVESGKVRYVGCSNWSAAQLSDALTHCQAAGLHALSSVQPPYNLVNREIEADLIPLCADRAIGVLSYSPLAAGFLTGKYRRDSEVPTGSRFDVIPGHQPIYFTDHGYGVVERLRQVADHSGRSMVDLALAWTLTRPGVTSVLIGARNTAQVDQAFLAESAGMDETLCRQLTQ